MKIYCMSDIHGCLAAFEEALDLFEEHLEEKDTRLLLLGDYIHGGEDNYGVLDKIMAMQQKYGYDKVIALMGNHEEFVLYGSTINHMIRTMDDDQKTEMSLISDGLRIFRDIMWRAIRFLSMQGLRKMPEISGTGQPGRIFSQENFRHKQGKSRVWTRRWLQGI